MVSLKRLNLNHSSMSLCAPVQNKSLIFDTETKESVKKGLKILKSMIKHNNLKHKRKCFSELNTSLNESKCETISSIEEQQTEPTLEVEEISILKTMKLLMILENADLKKSRKAWQQWIKFTKIRNDLLTVNQLNMYKVLQRMLYKFELASMGKKFYLWRYSYQPIIEKAVIEHNEQEIQTNEIIMKEIMQINSCEIQTDNVFNNIETTSVEINTSIIETKEVCEETKLIELNDQETQTYYHNEDTFKTPEDDKKRSKNDCSEIKQSDISNRRSLNNFPLQIKKLENIAKPLKLEAEFADFKEVKEIASERIERILTTKIEEIVKPTPSTARQEYSQLQENLLESSTSNKEVDEDDTEEIAFCIAEESIDENNKEEKGNGIGKRLSSHIRVPPFKMSKTYDKRAPMPNLRYV